MIFDGKKLVPREFVLTTLAAARRSNRLGPRASARRPWMPPVLRWKKRPAGPNMVQTVNHFASLTRIASFSQFHFYLDQFLINRGIVSARSNDSGRPAGDRARRVNDHSPAELVRATPRPSRDGSFQRTPRQSEGPVASRKKTESEKRSLRRKPALIVSSEIVRTFLARDTSLFRGAIARRKRSVVEAPAASTPGYSSAMPERVFAGPSRSRGITAAAPVSGARVKRGIDIPKSPGAGFESVFGRRDELVWRRVTDTRVVDEERVHSRRTVDQQIETSQQKAMPATGRAFSSPSGPSPAGFTVTNLDPAMVDRLTNDIIRQVEKRARIERERRGIM